MQPNKHDFNELSMDRGFSLMWTGDESNTGTARAYGTRVTQRGQKSASLRGSYGFTLVELMIVIAMIGVLSALGIFGFRKYIRAAAAAEVKAVIQGIRVSQEAVRAETFQYRSCSVALDHWYPAPPDDKKHHWDNGQTGNPEHDCWQELNVTTDGPVRFGYAVMAGIAPQPNPIPNINYCTNWVEAHAPIDGPWFVVQAAGDQNADGVLSRWASSSNSGQICNDPMHGDDE